jgi:hypothetical protein
MGQLLLGTDQGKHLVLSLDARRLSGHELVTLELAISDVDQHAAQDAL